MPLSANRQEIHPRDIVRQIYTTGLKKPPTDLVVQKVSPKGLVVGETADSPPKKDLKGRIRYIPPDWVEKIRSAQNN